jgi:hypothetical protein
MKVLALLLTLISGCLGDEATDIVAAMNVSEAIWLTCRNITYQP